jgi:hypothetical protein
MSSATAPKLSDQDSLENPKLVLMRKGKEWIHEFFNNAKVKENEVAITVLRKVKVALEVTYQGLRIRH